jgi:archaellum component FlaC
MDADQIEILGTLRSRIREIMTALESEKEKSDKLRNEFETLKAKYNQQSRKFEDLEQKYNNLKLAKVMVGNDDEGHDARIKVNRIVREIDKCIALLNR